MSHFCAPPEFVLTGREELLEALAHPQRLMDFRKDGSPDLCDKRVKSTFVCDLIREIEASGKYPYNSTVYDLTVERLGLDWPKHDDATKNRALSWLVYYAQEFLRHDRLIEAGYSRLTDEMVQAAFDQKAKIEIFGESIFGSTTRGYNVREINGKLYVMKPKARNYAIRIEGQPARIASKTETRTMPARKPFVVLQEESAHA